MIPIQVAEGIFQRAADAGRFALTEAEAYDLLESIGLTAPKRGLVAADDIPLGQAELSALLAGFPGERVVLKVSSSRILHKTDSGGVRICAKASAGEALARMAADFPDAEGVLVCEFVEHAAFALGQELMLGLRLDRAFGPVLSLGVGGTDAEALTAALRPGHSPGIVSLDEDAEPRWGDLIEGSWIWRYVSGRARGANPLADDARLLVWLQAFAALAARFRDGSGSRWAIEELEVNPLVASRGRLVAVDGLVRFRPASAAAPRAPAPVRSILRPASIAVAGVSEKRMNMGRIILGNLTAGGFPKDRLYVLKPGCEEIDGVRCRASLAELPETVDLLILAIPSAEAPAILEEAAASGKARGVVAIGGGMGEKAGGEAVRDRILALVQEGRRRNPDFALLGGNSLGVFSSPARANALFIPASRLPSLAAPGSAGTAFISQSGAFIVSVLSKNGWLRPDYCVSLGNQMDATICDVVEEACRDGGVRVVLLYIEGLKDGEGSRLSLLIRRARSRGVEFVAYLAGRTSAGQKAVMGHTASIAGDFAVARSVLSRAGAVLAETFDEFEDCAKLACHWGGRRIAPARVFLLSNAGFETAGMADQFDPGRALQPAELDAALAGELEAVLREARLDSIVEVKNPLDLSAMADEEVFLRVARAAAASPAVGALAVCAVPLTPALRVCDGGGPDDRLAAGLARLSRESGKPAVFCVAAGTLYDAYADAARRQGLPVFRSADRAVRALAKFGSIPA